MSVAVSGSCIQLFRYCWEGESQKTSDTSPTCFLSGIQASHWWRRKSQSFNLIWFCDQRYVLCTCSAFSALTLLVGHQEEHPACKHWLMRCWCGYLSGARCRLFAYGPADATAIPKPHHLLPHLNPDWFYLSGTGLFRLSWKRGRQMVVV